MPQYGRSALHVASREGHLSVVLALLEVNADVNVVDQVRCSGVQAVTD